MKVDSLDTVNNESCCIAIADDVLLDESDDDVECVLLEEDKDVELKVDQPHYDNTFDATRVYLNELGKSKLLTAEEEKNYGKITGN